jgi:hypothetical protein
MLGIRILLAACVVTLSVPAHAETKSEAVALLPLDADARMAIYGQPVASEIARALVAGGIDVVVVGPKMAMPDRAKLIVDGTIGATKADLVTLSLRVRNPVDGTTLATTQAQVQGLANIDKAAADVSAKILPIVREKLEAQKPKEVIPVEPKDPKIAVVPPDVVRPLLVGVSTSSKSASQDALKDAFVAQIAPWAARQRREPKTTEAKLLRAGDAVKTIKAGGTDLGIAFEIKSFSISDDTIPLGRARVHVVVADAAGVLFDRVVVTDSVVGDKNIKTDVMAARVAREVLDILRPHLKRLVTAWR